MIIDAHAHIFAKIAGQRGKEKTSPDKYGKVQVGNYVSQILPPFLINSCFDAELLINMMDYSGVDRAVLVQNPTYGIINEEVAEAVQNYPDRFIGTIQVDPLVKNAIEIVKSIVTSRQSVLKIELSEGWGWTGIYPGLKLDNPEFIQIWELVSDMGLQVIIDPGPIDNPGYQIREFDKISSMFPNVKILLEHLGYLTKDLINNDKALARRLELVRLAQKDNVYLGFSATNVLLDDDYPCLLSLELLHEAITIAGVDKILWGSDIPSTLGKYTYRQMIDVVLKHASFLADYEKEKLLGTNAIAFFNQFVLAKD
jgi:predicted TIM-barrel fold metal-dependent hydrolase